MYKRNDPLTIPSITIPSEWVNTLGGYILRAIPDGYKALGINLESYFNYPHIIRGNFLHLMCRKQKLSSKFVLEFLKKEKAGECLKVLFSYSYSKKLIAEQLKNLNTKELIRVWKKSSVPDRQALAFNLWPVEQLPLLMNQKASWVQRAIEKRMAENEE